MATPPPVCEEQVGGAVRGIKVVIRRPHRGHRHATRRRGGRVGVVRRRPPRLDRVVLGVGSLLMPFQR